jgi:hypothetical protein
METRNYVIVTLSVALCISYSGPSLGLLQAPNAYQTSHRVGARHALRPREAPRAYQSPGAYDTEAEALARGTICGENGLYANGTGTCCSRIQTNPPSCQPPPLASRRAYGEFTK